MDQVTEPRLHAATCLPPWHHGSTDGCVLFDEKDGAAGTLPTSVAGNHGAAVADRVAP